MATTAPKEDPRQIGEWPDFETAQAETKSPFGYWDGQDRRNFGETLHENDDIKSIWMVGTVCAGGTMQPGETVRQLLAVLGLLALVGVAAKVYDAASRRPTTEREMQHQ